MFKPVILSIQSVLLLVPLSIHAVGSLENPRSNSAQSGISVISGWHCDANRIEVQIDNRRRMAVAYPTERRDTAASCGDTDNGFVFLFNYGLLGDGPHTIRAYADGEQFDSATFTVTTLGESFVRGLSKDVTVADFPNPGDMTVLRWDESKQNFALQSVTAAGNETDDIWSVQHASINGVDFQFHLEQEYSICYIHATARNTTGTSRTILLYWDIYEAPGVLLGVGAAATSFALPGNAQASRETPAWGGSCDPIYSWNLNYDMSWVR